MSEEGDSQIWGSLPVASVITINGRRISWAELGVSLDQLEGITEEVKLGWLIQLTGIVDIRLTDVD